MAAIAALEGIQNPVEAIMKQKYSLVMLVNAMEPRGKVPGESWGTKTISVFGGAGESTSPRRCHVTQKLTES